MLTTAQLIKAFVLSYSEYYKDKEISIQDYALHGTILKIEFNYPRVNITDLDKKYGMTQEFNFIEIHILDYITFATQYKPE